MERPSSHWPGFTGLGEESNKRQQIQRVLSSADFEYLARRGMESRRKHQSDLSAQVVCSINLTHFASGMNNLVLEVAFSDNVYWVARIPYRPLDDNGRESMLSEIAAMKIIKKYTTVPVAHVFDVETSSDQPFGHPFVLMECLSGRTLPDGVARSIPREHHPKVAKQLANVFAELQNLTFSRIGRLWCGDDGDQPIEIMPMEWHATPGPLHTSLEYFYNQRQSENREMMALHPDDPDWVTACWVLKTALTQIIIEDRVHGPFPLCHLDLHYGNMLFDGDYNLTGIVDWNSAQAAPLEQLSVCPEFATFPGLSEEENQPMVELRNMVVDSLREMEEQREQRLPMDLSKEDSNPLPNLTSLSTYMASRSADITYRQYMSSPRGSLFAGKMVAELMYGKSITWEQLREAFGAMRLF